MDVLTVGGATIDSFLQIDHGIDGIHVDKESGELRIKAGEKYEVDACVFSAGGNACNVAIGLSRLGCETGLCAEIGTDEFAQKITNALDKEHVSKEFLLQTPHQSTSFAIALNVSGERTLFVEHVKRTHEFHLDTLETKWVYLTSLGDVWTDAYAHIASVMQEKKLSVAFNPGTHQLEMFSKEVAAIFPLSAVLFVNKQEAIKIIKFYLEKDVTEIAEILPLLQTLGPKTISVTDGNMGGYAIDTTGSMWHMPIIVQEVVERTGAGDGYATGFLTAIMEGKETKEAMRYGALNAASVIGSIGAQQGLLSQVQLSEKLQEHMDVQPTQL